MAAGLVNMVRSLHNQWRNLRDKSGVNVSSHWSMEREREREGRKVLCEADCDQPGMGWL